MARFDSEDKVKRKMKKAQVTVFIIISLIIITMAGVALYMRSQIQTEQGEEQIRKQQVSAVKLDPVREYIVSCLSITSAQGFELLGEQGGYIYQSQGGIIPDPFIEDYAEYQFTNVHYGIYRPLSDVGTIFYANTPAYPFPTFPVLYHPVTGEAVFSNYMKGYYGRNKIPPMLKSSVDLGDYPQEVYLDGELVQAQKKRENSIQEQLEKFTVNGTLECLDWSDFERQGLNITEEGKPNITVEFAEADVSFYMNWPLEIKDAATSASTKMNEFIVIYPVRMERIHTFAKLLMDGDVGNISYDIRAGDGEVSSYIIPDVKGKDDLVKVIDSQSYILGEEYEFRFMRENRPPAIFKINETVVNGPLCNESRIELSGENNLTFRDSCGIRSFNLTFKMIDPDEEILGFNYSLIFVNQPGPIKLSKPRLAYEITKEDANSGDSRPNFGLFQLNVSVTDGQFTDWQVINISTAVMR